MTSEGEHIRQYLARRADGVWVIVHAGEKFRGEPGWANENGGRETPAVVYALPTGRVAPEPSMALRKLRATEVASAKPIT